ncbi:MULTISPECIES: fimbrial protein [Enterobacterales]|uniref:fimbrial protein n=1 Tax=Enterobacterales TaxID=91347 RepID=UPI0008480D8B|nr:MULTISPECIES: fimbrial protein [Enterobacterales]ODQ07092.1 fimbrial protein [Shigella sp. FC130]OEI94487.1 fimbrial protein [Shigella sp. FC1655]WOO48738.1 fimbrial protein [Hafnia alvei]WPF03204.1 fimbrial protein [Proteus vulgaris]
MQFNKKNIHSKSVMLFCTGIFSLMPISTMAYLQGEVRTNGGPNIFYAALDNTTFPNNRAGETTTVKFSLPDRYDGTVHCPSTNIDKRALTYFKATTDLLPVGNNFYQLNEYVDVRIKFEIWGPDPLPTVPFENKENKRNNLQGCTRPESPKPHISSGSSGELTFRLRKPIINGVSLNGQSLAQMYAMVSYRSRPTGYGNEPISKLIITSGIITTEDKCIFNNGAPITFDFGNVGNTSDYLNGQNYKITRNIQIRCEGGSFTNPNSKIMFKIQTGSSGVASFNADYLGTTGSVDRTNLGIVLRDKSGTIVPPNKYFSVGKLNNFTGNWEVSAAPIAKTGSKIPEGEFSAHATLVAEFM